MYLLPGDSGIVHIVIISLLQLKASASRAVPVAEPVSMAALFGLVALAVAVNIILFYI